MIRMSMSTMVEGVGFEPTVQISPNNTLAGCRFRPLSQPSLFGAPQETRTLTPFGART